MEYHLPSENNSKPCATKWSRVPHYVTNCFAACDIYPYTHRALLWKHPCKYLPPFCLLCCHGSHPRIVSLFFSLRPSLVFMTHNSQWKPQFSLSLIPLFPFTFFSAPKEQLAFLNHRCVFVACVCQGARAAGNSKQITNDGLLWQ